METLIAGLGIAAGAGWGVAAGLAIALWVALAFGKAPPNPPHADTGAYSDGVVTYQPPNRRSGT